MLDKATCGTTSTYNSYYFREQLTFEFSGKKLDKMDWFGKSDPYLEIHKVPMFLILFNLI